MKLQRIQLKISGKVQGVGFRQSTFIQARKLGLVGWVRNTLGGEVEVLAEADPQSLEFLVEWCQEGPPHASVEEVKIIEKLEIERLSFQTFIIESTL